MRFWLDMGVDGLRLDAIPYLIEREGTNNENLRETHEVIKQMRAASIRATRTACCWPRPTCGRRTCASTSATATSATWPTTSR
jgi:glycosidase